MNIDGPRILNKIIETLGWPSFGRVRLVGGRVGGMGDHEFGVDAPAHHTLAIITETGLEGDEAGGGHAVVRYGLRQLGRALTTIVVVLIGELHKYITLPPLNPSRWFGSRALTGQLNGRQQRFGPVLASRSLGDNGGG